MGITVGQVENKISKETDISTAIVEQFSDRAIISFVNATTAAEFIIIDIPEKANDLRDTLIDTSDGTENMALTCSTIMLKAWTQLL